MPVRVSVRECCHYFFLTYYYFFIFMCIYSIIYHLLVLLACSENLSHIFTDRLTLHTVDEQRLGHLPKDSRGSHRRR